MKSMSQMMGLSKKDRKIVFLKKLKYLGQIPVREGMIYFSEVTFCVVVLSLIACLGR